MRLLSDLLSIFFPPCCHGCDSLLPPSVKWICPDCRAALPRTFFNVSERNFMGDRIGSVRIERAVAPFIYTPDSRISRIVQDFKYRGFQSLAVEMGRILALEASVTGIFHDVDYIQPVPLHLIKLWKRGYNQALLLAKGVSRETGIPVIDLLKAIRHHRTQTGLDHEQRKLNTSGIFAVKKPESLPGRHILLIDDICTTGSTLVSAANAMLQAVPDSKISVLTLGVTPP